MEISREGRKERRMKVVRREQSKEVLRAKRGKEGGIMG